MFISCGSVNFKWILFFITPILMHICNLIEKNSKSDKNIFFFSFLRFFSRSLNFILWLILKKSLSSQKDKKDEEENSQKLDEGFSSIHEDSDEVNNCVKSNSIVSETILYKQKMEIKKKYLLEQYKAKDKLIFFTGILDFIATTIKYIFVNLKYIQKVSGGLNILSSCARLALMISLSYCFINNQKLQRHQYFSAIITLIVAIVSSILSLIMEDRDYNNNFWIKLILMSVPEILYCIMYICGAYYLVKKGNIYKLLFFNGVIGLILSTIMQLLVNFFSCNNIKDFFSKDLICKDEKIKTMKENFTSFGNFGGLLTFLLILIDFIEIICIWLLIYYFSIAHFAAVYLIPSFFEYIINHRNYKYEVIFIIGCVIIIIMALIYNEIIILKFCGFDTNTKIEITKRAKRDSYIEDSHKIWDNNSENVILDYSIQDSYLNNSF